MNDPVLQTLPSGSGPLSLAGLEAVYDRLAHSIDAVAPGRAELFLVKMVLLLAQDAGNTARFEELCTVAARDL